MWYFSWILGVSLACSFGLLNAMWYELKSSAETVRAGESLVPIGGHPLGPAG